MSERDPVPPALGERRAIGGYHPQYRIAAALILRALRAGTLEWIRLADPEAGRVDDLQIGTSGRLNAYQVKWSRFAGTLTFNELIKASAERPSLISQLADGWKRLGASHQDQRVTVHLITDDFPSTNDHVPDAAHPNAADHFASFLAEAWEPKSRRVDSAVPERWQRAWAALSAASGLQPHEFENFVGDCRLDLSYRLPDDELGDVESTESTREAIAWKADIDELQLALRHAVASCMRHAEVEQGFVATRHNSVASVRVIFAPHTRHFWALLQTSFGGAQDAD